MSHTNWSDGSTFLGVPTGCYRDEIQNLADCLPDFVACRKCYDKYKNKLRDCFEKWKKGVWTQQGNIDSREENARKRKLKEIEGLRDELGKLKERIEELER